MKTEKLKDNLPSMVNINLDDAPLGVDNIDDKDLAIPKIILLQSNSPQVETGESPIAGARGGYFLNLITNDVYKEGLNIIPLATRKIFAEYKSRDDGGGWVEDHVDVSILDKCKEIGYGKRVRVDNNNEVVETHRYLLMAVDIVPAVISDGDNITSKVDDAGNEVLALHKRGLATFDLYSTGVSVANRWNSVIKTNTIMTTSGVKPLPIYGMIYSLKSIPKTNAKGSWFISQISKNEDIFQYDNGKEDFEKLVEIYKSQTSNPNLLVYKSIDKDKSSHDSQGKSGDKKLDENINL